MKKKKDSPKANSFNYKKGPRKGPIDPENSNGQTPVWSITIFDVDGPWGRELCDRDGAIWNEIFPKLRAYESMTWSQITTNKKRDHSVSVGGISKAARDRLIELNLDDIESLFRFRLTGKIRVWGIREGRIFRLLWWDPEHEIWPVDV